MAEEEQTRWGRPSAKEGKSKAWDYFDLELPGKKKVKCKKHPFTKNHTTDACPKPNIKCKICGESSHNFLLCPKKKTSTKSTIAKTMTSNTNMHPVMVQTAYLKAQSGVRLGTMFDLASTDHYITHKKARKLGYRGVDVELIIEDIKGVEYT